MIIAPYRVTESSIIIQYWMILVITFWMIISHDYMYYHPILDDYFTLLSSIQYWMILVITFQVEYLKFNNYCTADAKSMCTVQRETCS